jgi:hypothetical protein
MGRDFNTSKLNKNFKIIDMESPEGMQLARESVKIVRQTAKKAREIRQAKESKEAKVKEAQLKVKRDAEIKELLAPYSNPDGTLRMEFEEMANFKEAMDILENIYGLDIKKMEAMK